MTIYSCFLVMLKISKPDSKWIGLPFSMPQGLQSEPALKNGRKELQSKHPSTDFLTVAQVAEILKVGVCYVARLIRKKKLKGYSLVPGGRWRVLPADLDAFLCQATTRCQERKVKLTRNIRKQAIGAKAREAKLQKMRDRKEALRRKNPNMDDLRAIVKRFEESQAAKT
jgi:excisionase family DNA binding protein